MSRVVIVGESNPYGADPQFALYHLPEGASGDRLRRIMGLDPDEYLDLGRVNLCIGKWSAPVARTSAQAIYGRMGADFADVEVVIMLGTKVRDAFGFKGITALKPFTSGLVGKVGMPSVVALALPHPSGRNLVWNEPGVVDRARACLRVVAPEVPWGHADARMSDLGAP